MSVPTSLQGIAKKAQSQKKHRFQALYRLLKEEMLLECWRDIRKDAAFGVDRVSAEQYQQNLQENTRDLVEWLKRKSYRAKLLRRRYIPKSEGGQRPLGIPATEDKLLQLAVKRILEAIYEQDFLRLSYGYRPGVGAQDAVETLTIQLQFGRYNVVLLIGVVLLLNKLDVLSWNIWKLQPIILIAIGLALLLRWRIGGPRLESSLVTGRKITHIFGGGEERVAQNFEGGQLTVIFGGSKLDLLEATLAGGKAVLDVMIVFGGLELRVPRERVVKVQTTVLFGGVDSKHRQPSLSEAQGELIITGTVLFGGIEVKDR